MITVFNRAVILEEPNAEAAAKACAALRNAGIPYKMKIAGSGPARPMVRAPRTGRTGSLGAGFSGSGLYMGGGVPQAWSEGGSSSALHIVYVRKKDLERAREACGRRPKKTR